MSATRILWATYGRISYNYIKQKPWKALSGFLAGILLLYAFLNRRSPDLYAEQSIVTNSIFLAAIAGALLNPNDKLIEKDSSLLRSLASRRLLRWLTLQKTALLMLINLLIFSRFYRGQALRWDIFALVMGLSFFGVFLLRRAARQSHGESKPWIQTLRLALIRIWPLSAESKAVLRLHFFSHWQNYRMLSQALYIVFAFAIGTIIAVLEMEQPQKEFMLLLPLGPTYFILSSHGLENLAFFASLNSQWRRPVYLSEWLRWTLFWLSSFSLIFLIAIGFGLRPQHPYLLFALAGVLGTLLMAWAAYLRLYFSDQTLLRIGIAFLSLLFPLIIPIIIMLGRRHRESHD